MFKTLVSAFYRAELTPQPDIIRADRILRIQSLIAKLQKINELLYPQENYELALRRYGCLPGQSGIVFLGSMGFVRENVGHHALFDELYAAVCAFSSEARELVMNEIDCTANHDVLSALNSYGFDVISGEQQSSRICTSGVKGPRFLVHFVHRS